MLECNGYIRISDDKQEQGASLDAQKELMIRFAASKGIVITKWFVEICSAAKTGRPEFNRMMADLKRKRRKKLGVVFHEIDRSSRNFEDWGSISWLLDQEYPVYFAADDLDLTSPAGRMAADIKMVFAVSYSRNLAREVKKGQFGRLNDGLYPWKAPLGYVDNGKGGKVKTIDPERGPLVREMFELYATGNYPIWALTKEMKTRGLTSKNGNPVTKNGIEKMLRNPFYAGVISVKAGTYAGAHEPLISVQLFELVRAVALGKDNRKTSKHTHRFPRLFKCGHCGGGMIPEIQKGHTYYRCRTKGCATKTMREEVLEERIQQKLKQLTLSDSQIAKIRYRFEKFIEEHEDVRLAAVAPAKLKEVKLRLSRLSDKFIDDLIDEEIYRQKHKALLLEEKKWEDMAAKKQSKEQKLETLRKFCERIKSLVFSYEHAKAAEKRSIVKFASANRFIKGRNVYLEPPKWLVYVENILNPSYCEHSRGNTRTVNNSKKALSGLFEYLEADEYVTLLDT